MKITKLVVFGDSWSFGDELLDPSLIGTPQAHSAMKENQAYRYQHAWPWLVAQHFDLEVVNLASNGQSLQSMMWTALWWVDHHPLQQTLFLLGLTHAVRTSWFVANPEANRSPWDRFEHSCTVDQEPWITANRIYISQGMCPGLMMVNRQVAVNFFQGLSQRYNVPVMMFDCFTDHPSYYGACHILPGTSAQDWIGGNTAIHGHPNEKGHRIIRDVLIKEIEPVILSK